MFAGKQHSLFFFRRDGIEIYPLGSVSPLFFQFPPEAVQHLDVLDAKKLETAFEDFSAAQNLTHPSCYFVLSEEIIFYKIFSLENKENTPENIKLFYDEVLFDPSELVKGEVTLGSNIIYFGANKKIYTIIKKAITKQLGNVVNVLPVFAFQIQLNLGPFGQPSLSPDFLDVVIDQAPRLKSTNLLEKDLPPRPAFSPLPTQVEVGDRNKLLPAIVFVTIALGFLGYLLYTNFVQITKKPVATPTPVPATQLQTPSEQTPITQAPLPPAEGSVLSRTEGSSAAATSGATAVGATSSGAIVINPEKQRIQINILNASGIAGQAALVRDELSRLGYTQFETGNTAPVSDTTQRELTLVEYAPTMLPAMRQEILQAVQKNFPGAVGTESAQLGKFDIVITTVK